MALTFKQSVEAVVQPLKVQLQSIVRPIKQNTSNLTALDDSISHACIIKGVSTGAPNEIQDLNLGGTDGLVSENNRYVLTNPFGANVPVIVKAEIFLYGLWSCAGWFFNGQSTSGRGTRAHYAQGLGIILQTGNDAVGYDKASLSGGGHGGTNITLVTSARCRIHVWRVKA